MNASKRLKILLASDRTVFTMRDLRILWRDSAHTARISAARMAEDSLIQRISRGYYALRDRYDERELANRIVAPSYISFQSALFYTGMSFQDRGEVDSAARFDYKKRIGDRTYRYFALKEELLFNRDGIKNDNGVFIALPERAILDCFYLGFLPDIDRPSEINGALLRRLGAVYPQGVQRKAEALI